MDDALEQHEQWDLGDGLSGDGPHLHLDSYNSFVISPLLLDIVATMADQYPDWRVLKEPLLNRAQRAATIFERLISPEGPFPVLGRSITSRFGACHLLAQMALRQELHETIPPAQVRGALTQLIRRMIEMPGTFDAKGWFPIGFCGHQPALGESSISTGSLDLCATVFLPLGLSADNPFWQGEAEWTARKAWSGKDTLIDQALDWESP
jgi:hypothetical protein